MKGSEIDELIRRHLAETDDGIVDQSVSQLARGQSTVRDYFILKVDLVDSTKILYSRSPAAYVRLAHAYLSTIDHITQEFGAEAIQTEYQGDGLLALFPQRGVLAEYVLGAAACTHYAVKRMSKLDPVLGSMNLQIRIVLHYGQLSVANLGPYGESHRVAIGIPIHEAAKWEKDVDAGVIWASDQFVTQLKPASIGAFIKGHYPAPATPPPKRSVPTLLQPSTSAYGVGEALTGPYPTLGDLLAGPTHSAAALARALREVKQPERQGCVVSWSAVYNALGLKD